MPVIDADCHVIECEDTWQFFDEAEARYAPLYLAGADGRRYLAIDGRLRIAADLQRHDRFATRNVQQGWCVGGTAKDAPTPSTHRSRRKLSPDASVHFDGGGYEASMPLLGAG